MKLLSAVLVCTWASHVSAQSTLHFGCVLQHCAGKFLKAVRDPVFQNNSKCEQKCNKIWNTDTTQEKLHYQNCTTTCAVSYESPDGDDFLACVIGNNCIEFPPIPGGCPYKKEHIQPDASLASLNGEFWQHRGKNPLWDCYSCQHIHSMFLSNDTQFCAKTVMPGKGPVQAPCWAYTYSYDLYLDQGGTKTFQQTWQLPGDVPKGEPIGIYYDYMKTWHNETWYIFQQTENYVLLGDCSYMMNWVNYGSIVWVRAGHELTDAENAAIKAVYKDKLGWEYEDFCYTKHGSDKCRNATAQHGKGVTPRISHRAPKGVRRPSLSPAQIQELQAKLSPLVV
jgi:hypothetical protein